MIERVERAITGAIPSVTSFTVETSPQKNNGHYTTNVAFLYAKKKGSSLMDAARTLAERIKETDTEGLFEKVDIAPPGFINFWLAKSVFQNEVRHILNTGTQYGASDVAKGKRARVEYVSANPTGPLHIGNARGGPFAETLSNVLAFSGYKVLREYLHNDIGGQVEKLGRTLWYWYKHEFGDDIEFPEDGYRGEYPLEVARAACTKFRDTLTENDIDKLTLFGLGYIFKENIETLRRLGIQFDRIVSERELVESGKTREAIDDLKKRGVTKEREGALWFAPQDEFLEDRESVLVRSNGKPTYFASDIAYHKEKFTSGYDLVITVLGSNHHGHVPKLRALTTLYGFDPEHFHVLLYQHVRVKKGEKVMKMAKRAGTYVTAKEVLDEVGVDAMLFFLLMRAPNSHMDFDLQLAKDRSMENPVYYVQYGAVRAKSILAKAGLNEGKGDLSSLTSDSEIGLMHTLSQFPDIVAQVAKTFEVHRLAHYATNLAHAFHLFYEKERVIGEKEDIMCARLALVRASLTIFQNLSRLLGVSVPDKM